MVVIRVVSADFGPSGSAEQQNIIVPICLLKTVGHLTVTFRILSGACPAVKLCHDFLRFLRVKLLKGILYCHDFSPFPHVFFDYNYSDLHSYL